MKKHSRGFWLDRRDNDFEEYISSGDAKEDFQIAKFFEDFQATLWGAFLRGYDSAQHRMHWTALLIGLGSFVLGFATCAIILYWP